MVDNSVLVEGSRVPPRREEGRSPAGAAARWLLPGLLAGLVFLAIGMVVGTFTTTTWALPEGVAETAGVGGPGYGLQPRTLLVGVAVHLALSVCLGVLFTALARSLRIRGGVLVAGAVGFAGVESAVAIWGVLHTLTPGTLHFLFGALPLWASVLGHLAYGVVLGLLMAGGPLRATWAGRAASGTAPLGGQNAAATEPAAPPRAGERTPRPRSRTLHRLLALILGLLVAQYLLGMAVNLFVQIADAHPGARSAEYCSGVAHVVRWAIGGGSSLLLAAHVSLGLLIIATALASVGLAVATRRRGAVIATVVSFLAVLGAGFNGASFLIYNHDASSMIMATLFMVGLGSNAAGWYLTRSSWAAGDQRSPQTV